MQAIIISNGYTLLILHQLKLIIATLDCVECLNKLKGEAQSSIHFMILVKKKCKVAIH
jgi:hypothetical protein